MVLQPSTGTSTRGNCGRLGPGVLKIGKINDKTIKLGKFLILIYHTLKLEKVSLRYMYLNKLLQQIHISYVSWKKETYNIIT